MSQITRYVLRQTALALVAITLALTAAIWLAYSLRFIDFIVNRGLPLATFLYLIVLTLPRFLAIALPIALFCAILFVFHRLMTDSELVVLRATGISDARLSRPVLGLAMLVMMVVAALNLHFAPAAERVGRALQFAIRNDFASIILQPGVFKPVGNGLTVYVEELGEPGHFRGIMIHDDNDQSRRVTVMAERGAMVATATGPRIVLLNGNRQEFDRAAGKLSILHFDRYTVDLGLVGEGIGTRWRDTNERSLGELMTATASEVGDRNVLKFRAEGHERLASVLYPLSLTAVALIGLLAGRSGRRGYARRLLLSAAGALVVLAGALWFKGVAAKTGAVIPLLYALVLAPVATGGVLLFVPARWWRRTSARFAALRSFALEAAASR